MTLWIVIGAAIVGVVLAVWITRRTPHPENASSHYGEREPRDRYAGRSLAGPADAGAESMATPDAGEIGPSASGAGDPG